MKCVGDRVKKEARWREKRKKMGIERMAPFVKEAVQKTAEVAKALCFLHVTNAYLCSVVQVVGPSMLPTFNINNLVLAERISTRLGKVGAGDVVIVRSPENPMKLLTKRIKGVGGDVVSFQHKTVVVPKGHVWVAGDNMHDSRDSRQLVQFLMHMYKAEFCLY